MSLDITTAAVEPELLDLPWQLPLEHWPTENIAALPKGLSRHTVRFAHLNDHVIAIKETLPELARREYDMLKKLQSLDVPCVEPFAIINNRTTAEGEELLSVLITRHLKFSLPYRAMWSQGLRPETATRLVDALAVLLVRLHIAGFFWGDVSLSNTLFRRDAGAFAAYLVDAETGQLYEGGLSNGQRENDLEIARVNIAGELLDLIASGNATPGVDANETSDRIMLKYRELWTELTGVESFETKERWKINKRVSRLNALGFDIEEMTIRTDGAGSTVKIQPKVVDAGPPSPFAYEVAAASVWAMAHGLADLLSNGRLKSILALPAAAQETIPLPDLLGATHIHGIAAGTGRDSVTLATHHGLWSADLATRKATRIGTSQDDFMGFSPVSGRTGEAFASGHPATGGKLAIRVGQRRA